jgi:hypothetical protein
LKTYLRILVVLIAVALIAFDPGATPNFASAQADPDRPISSNPPDNNNYSRPAIPADRPISISSHTAFIRDTIISNTNANLATTDTSNDGETSIAINPANPNEIVISAFAGSWGANAPIFHSTDAGATWTKQFTIPAPPGITTGVIGCPCDQTFDYGRGGRLSGTFLAGDLFSGTSTNPAQAASWGWFLLPPANTVTQRTNTTNAVGNPDQPWLLVNRDPTTAAQDNVYVAYDDFTQNPVTMRVAVALGTNPPNFTVDNQAGVSGGPINPGLRMAADPRNGTMYVLWQESPNAGQGGSRNINYRLNRSTDAGATWTLNGNAGGIIVANADSTQPWPKFGGVNALLGGVNHAAVDPTNGDLYYAYGSRDNATGNDRLAIRRITTAGGTMTVGAENFVTGQVEAAIPSVAINSNGVVGVFYYTFDGISAPVPPATTGFPIFTAHFARSTNQGQTFTDLTLLTSLSPARDTCATAGCTDRQRVLGDYMQVKSVGTAFFGAFTGNGAALGRTVSNHDPIFFRITDNEAPTVSLTGPTSENESNAPITYTFTVSDPDGDGFTVKAGFPDCGTGGTLVAGSLTTTSGGGTFQCRFLDGPATPVVRIQVTDNHQGDNKDSNIATVNVTVANVAPTITGITGPTNALTGTDVPFVGTATDPSPVDTAAGFTWEWKVNGAVVPGQTTATLTYRFTACGTFTIGATAKDKDNGVSVPASFGPVSVYEAHFRPPLNEGAVNTVQKGRVIPVSITIGCNGTPLTGLSPAIQLLNGDVAPGTETTSDEVETLSSSAADTTGVMREIDSKYLYNLQVPGGAAVTSGTTFTIRVRPFGDANPAASMYLLLQVR